MTNEIPIPVKPSVRAHVICQRRSTVCAQRHQTASQATRQRRASIVVVANIHNHQSNQLQSIAVQTNEVQSNAVQTSMIERQSVAIGTDMVKVETKTVQTDIIEHQSVTVNTDMVEVQSKAVQTDLNDAQGAWCICRGTKGGKMIFCENNDCLIKWFHTDCIRMEVIPEEDWYCPNCSILLN